MSIPPNNSRRNLRVTVRESRKCTMKKCNNIILFNINKYIDQKFCYKHNNANIQTKINTLERPFYIIDNKFIIPKKKNCYSISYYNKIIDVTKKIIYLRKKLFLKNNRKNRRGVFSYYSYFSY